MMHVKTTIPIRGLRKTIIVEQVGSVERQSVGTIAKTQRHYARKYNILPHWVIAPRLKVVLEMTI